MSVFHDVLRMFDSSATLVLMPPPLCSGPALMSIFHDVLRMFDTSATLVLAYPGSLPAPPFNRIFMQPFSKHKVRGRQ